MHTDMSFSVICMGKYAEWCKEFRNRPVRNRMPGGVEGRKLGVFPSSSYPIMPRCVKVDKLFP